eukprot:1167060-Pyramimonas_sp.AAC.2
MPDTTNHGKLNNETESAGWYGNLSVCARFTYPITAVSAVPRPLHSAYAVLTCQNFIAYVRQVKHAM